MKKRRILSLTLALALTASLTAPAFAAEEPETDEGYITVDVADLMGDSIDPKMLEAMPIPVSAEDAGFDPALWQELLENRENDGLLIAPNPFAGENEEDFDYAAYQAQQVEEYRAAHPGELESVGVAELLARHGYSDPMAAYMEDWGYDTEEEALTALYADYVDEREWAAWLQEEAQDYREDYPELWASFDAAAYFAETYGDWQTGEEYMRNNGLWTYQEFVDQLFVEYVDNQMGPVEDDWDWRPELTLSVNGDTLWDSSIYAENGVSYLPAEELNAILGGNYTQDTPVREAAKAAGWDVTWSAGANQVVLLNKADITRGWDFTNFDAMMNRLLKSAGYEKGKTFHTKETADITLTRFNTLDGDETYSFTVTADTVMRDNLLDLTLTADAAQLLQLLPQDTLDQMETAMPKLTFQNLKTMLTGCKLRLLLDLEAGTLYINAPILSLFDESITEKTWFSADLGDAFATVEMDQMWEMLAGSWNTADYLYGTLLQSVEDSPYTAQVYAQMGTMLNVMLGNEAVTEKNGAYTWQVDTATLDKMMKATLTGLAGDLGQEELAQMEAMLPSMSDFFQEYNITLTVDRDGRFTMAAALRLNSEGIGRYIAAQMYAPNADLGVIGGADGPTAMLVSGGLSGLLDLLDFRLAGESQGTADHATGTAEIHVKNQFKVEIKEVSDRVKDAAAPLTTPPDDAVILDLTDLF